jgi:hypothetical protein
VKKLLIIIFCLISICLSGCNADGSEDVSVPFESIASGISSGVRSQTLTVIRSDDELNSLWNEHAYQQFPVPDKPVVDFSNEMLVAIFLGNGSCMNSIDVTGVTNAGQSVVVEVSIRFPNPEATCIVAEQPFEIIKLQYVSERIGFNVKVTEF